MALIKVKPIALATKKWETNLPQAVEFIRIGVEAVTDEWAKGAIAASKAYKEAVTAPDIEQRYLGGIKSTGTEGWKEGMLKVGVDRIRDGVEKNIDKYSRRVAPYLEAIGKIDKPPRKPRGHPDNLNIVHTIARTLHELKRKTKGAA